MHEISKRQYKLLKLLLEKREFFSGNHYAKILEISDRTLYKDIDKINEVLRKTDTKIIKKPRKGICLSESNLLDEEILQLFKEDSSEMSLETTPLKRQILIAKYLFAANKKLSYQSLSEEFLVSKSSIANDLEQVQSVINGSGIALVSDTNGTKLVGIESDIQKAMKQFSYFIIDKSDVTRSFRTSFPDLLFEFLPKNMIGRVSVLLQENMKVQVEKLSDDYFQSLVLSISIFMLRVQAGFHVESQENFLFENLETLKTFFLTNELLGYLASRNQILFNANDFDYLNRQLIAHGFEPKLKDVQIQKKYDELVKKIIKEMSTSLQLDLTKDDTLYNSLLCHIVSMVYRFKVDVQVSNPLLEEIKQEYSVLYSTTWLVLVNIEKELGIRLTEDEIAFIMIHFQGAIDRTSSNRKVLVVCPTGIGTSELIANRLKRVFSPQDIVEVVSLRSMYKKDLSKIDLIVSSVYLENIDVPITYVSPLMSQQDLKKVSATYLDLFYETDEDAVDDGPFQNLEKIIDKNLIFLNESLPSKAECIKKITVELTKRNLVTAAFEKAIWDREKLGVTDMPTGVAIPHPSPQTVEKSKLVIMTLTKPIRWNLRTVNTIFFLCIAEKDLKDVRGILSDIYRIVASKETINRFILRRTKKEIVEVLGGIPID